jgi:hypothetical protein
VPGIRAAHSHSSPVIVDKLILTRSSSLMRLFRHPIESAAYVWGGIIGLAFYSCAPSKTSRSSLNYYKQDLAYLARRFTIHLVGRVNTDRRRVCVPP